MVTQFRTIRLGALYAGLLALSAISRAAWAQLNACVTFAGTQQCEFDPDAASTSAFGPNGRAAANAIPGFATASAGLTLRPPETHSLTAFAYASFDDSITLHPADPLLRGQIAFVTFEGQMSAYAAAVAQPGVCCSSIVASAGGSGSISLFDAHNISRQATRGRTSQHYGVDGNDTTSTMDLIDIPIRLGVPFSLRLTASASIGVQSSFTSASGVASVGGVRVVQVSDAIGVPITLTAVTSLSGENYNSADGSGASGDDCKPHITVQPVIGSPFPACGQTLTLSFAYSIPGEGGGDATPIVIWTRDGRPLSDGATPWGSMISGSMSESMTVTDLHANDAGLYEAIVFNACGMQMTTPVTLRMCRVDVNCSGAVSVQDIFDFLGLFFGNDTRADFNSIGGVTVQDIFDFLAAYFAGCP